MRRSLPLFLLGLLSFSALLHADNPVFDLAGPKVDVHVKRGEITLPISETANLMPGDRLWIHPDLPESQSTHFVLVVAFLRGATNPPPQDWFTRVETWTHAAREEGIFVTVPNEAQQALVFLAPETGGDFTTLRRAVHDRPGAFVRAAQDLQAASWDRMRLDLYLNEVRSSSQSDPKILKERTENAARSLGIRIQKECFDKPADQQATCLTQHTEGMVLDDANAQSLVTQLANGSTADLMNQLSYSALAGAGSYSPYVGAIVDMAKILSSLHTAHFQYIPALALPTKDTLNLRLNEPPSFRDPKSVVVVALPPIGPSKPPPMRPLNPSEILCAQKPDLVFAADGAPMVFGTSIAHQLTLHIEGLKDAAIDVPATTDPAKGGLVPSGNLTNLPPGELTAVINGKWGFDDWEGPHYKLISAASGKWTLAADDQSALIVGRDDTLHIQGDSTLCVSKVELAGVQPLPLTWKSPKPDTLAVDVPMKDAIPGLVTIQIHQYGVPRPDTLSLDAYAEAASLDHLTVNIGDKTATLKGTRLDEVAKAAFSNIAWTPDKLTRVQDFDQLSLKTESSTADLEAGSHLSAKVALRDGRELKIPVQVDPPRPQVTLLSKGSQDSDTTPPSPLHFGSPDDLPLVGKLVFFLKSVVPQKFPRNEAVEVAAEDGSFRTVLSLADGSLMLEDARTAIGTVDPLTRFGASAFGPLRARAVSVDGVPGDWMPLGTLVRMPALHELRCPRAVSRPCTLAGSNLFLLDSIAASQDFTNPIEVPADFTAAQITVPHPINGSLYLKLRDDPGTVQTLTMPVTNVAQGPLSTATAQPGAAASSSATEPAAKPESKPDSKPEAKSDSKPESKSEHQPDQLPSITGP